jgi:3-oxoacyl-(acyl-carrier-protein) synthase
VAMYHQIQGPNSTLCQNHLSGECALAYAVSLLEQEQADALVVGGVDELSSILLHSLNAVRALKSSPQGGSAHMGGSRPQPCTIIPGKGFMPGEGATCLVLERGDMPGRISKTVYGTLAAVTLTGARASQGHYEKDGKAMAFAMLSALDEARLKPDVMDIIALAANGVDELEDAETKALEKVFGASWHHIPRVPVRYFAGEFGSAGLLGAATILIALREGTIPPYLQGRNLSYEPGDQHNFAPPRRAALRNGMVIGSTFGGASSCLIFSRAPGAE